MPSGPYSLRSFVKHSVAKLHNVPKHKTKRNPTAGFEKQSKEKIGTSSQKNYSTTDNGFCHNFERYSGKKKKKNRLSQQQPQVCSRRQQRSTSSVRMASSPRHPAVPEGEATNGKARTGSRDTSAMLRSRFPRLIK
ncbi:hypothetical protein CDAR_463011 [Caerostris darwini]|uniref:Uncharacterized protein n=1 Tax=Caerostris darwini TaxID=1538125 RepID=A0AAV4QBP5_9ARAC|nr:hypothetical protein CDAR_463011 [Caerostris darwini]